MVLYTGATVEEAIQKLSLNDLDIPRMKAHITVVARERKVFWLVWENHPGGRDGLSRLQKQLL